MAIVYHSLATGAFSQNWNDTALLGTNDVWPDGLSIVGYRGDNLTAVTGVDPQTVTADDTAPVVDINVNQTNPNTNTSGGVAEFEIADPVVAMQWSGTADAPYLVLHLDATGRSNLVVSFNARDIDGCTDNAIQSVAVQYRLGETGAWTNLPAGSVADTSTGPSLATTVTPVSVSLPAAADNQPKVQVRVITTNALGSDEWVGIDDISAASQAIITSTAQVTISDATIVEGDAGSSNLVFTVSRSDNTGTFNVDYATAETTAVAGTDFTASTGTLSFVAGGALAQTISVPITGDTTTEADETFTVGLSNLVSSLGNAALADAVATGTISNDDITITRISAVQDNGAASALAGQTVTVEAIVVGDFQNGDGDTRRNLNGFYLQEEATDADADALTSEGLFAFMGSALGDVQEGDRVRVTGTVSEYFGMTQLNVTGVSVVQAGAVADVSTMAAMVSLPAAGVTTNQNGAYQPDLEAYEGMLVTIPQTLTITEQFNLDRFNEIKLVAGDRPAQFTHNNAPSVTGLDAHLRSVGARTITYDDGVTTQNQPIGNLDGFGPSYTTANAPRMGDTTTGLTGVLDYQWAGAAGSGATWRIRAIDDGDNTFADVNLRTATPADVGGRLKVASLNVLNTFGTLNTNPSDDTSNSDPSDNTVLGLDSRGANTAAEFARQTAKLVNVLATMDADIVGLVELENDFLNDAPGNALDLIVDQLNTKAGAGTYAWIDPGQRHVGGDAIAVGYIYKPGKVGVAFGTTVQSLSDSDLAGIGQSSLLGQSSIGAIFDGANTSRNALAVTWSELSTGQSFTTIANHFKSKSGNGTGADLNALDGAGAWNNQRLLAATALDAWIDTNPTGTTGTTDADYMLLGDFNAYFQEAPVEYLISNGFENLQETRLTDPYSYVFDGQLGALDYIFANRSLAGQITGITEWHVNADEADALDYNVDFGRDATIFDANAAARISDHDPLLVGLTLNPVTTGTQPMPITYSGSANPTGLLDLEAASSITLAGAEISTYDAGSKRLFVTSATGLQIVDLSNPAAPVLLSTIAIATLSASGGDITSVAVKNGLLAVAIPDTVKTNPGKVVFLNAADAAILGSVTVGALPDMVTFSPDGTKLLVANEAEPLTTGGVTVDPNGSVSIVNLAGGAAAATVTTATFDALNGTEATLKAAGVRLDAGKTVAQALEPEYIAISPDGTKAMVTLQENNAMVVLDIATATFGPIIALGTKDHSLANAGGDFSDRDGVDIAPAPVKGLYMPDAIASYSVGGQTYYVVSNEGDAYDPFGNAARADSVRVSAATLDATLVSSIVNASATDVYTDEASIKHVNNLGRLNVSKFGDTDGDGDLDQLQSYGGRSFSIYDANGTIVFDSGDVIERATAALTPTLFNANDGLATAVDTRSDDKAAEPEGVTIGTIAGKTYAFVTLERAGGGVMAFDITSPTNVTFADYARREGDISAEGATFIPATDSPNGKPLVVVANEVSNTLTVYSATPTYQLQLLHYYGESGLLGVDTAPIMGAMIDKMDDQYANTLVLGEGDSIIPGPWLIAGADPALNSTGGIGTTALGRPDIAIMNAFGTDASALGNHEFDLGSPVWQGAFASASGWVGAQFPLITSNLNFAADSSMRGIADATLGGTATNAFAGAESSAIKGKIAPYSVVTQGGEKIGIVGSTTFELLSKTSPNGTVPKDDANAATSDLQEVAAYLQASIDALKAMGVNKIVMVDQLDTLQRNKDLAGLVSGIDVMVAGGGHERMGDATDVAVGFPGHNADFIADTYPIVTTGADGKPVLIVTTDTEYSYLGRLVVDFNAAGEIDTSKLNTAINGAYASTETNLQSLYGSTDTATNIIATSTIGTTVKTIVDKIDTVITSKDGNIFGYTSVYLEGDRVFGRTQEVNLGDISADANAAAAAKALHATLPVVSLKNGGGIRASVGSVDASGNKVPPLATDVKPAGGISQLDIENALRFDNKLMVFDTTADGLLKILNFAAGLSSGPTQQSGGYVQVGSIRFSYDPDLPAGSKVRNVALVDEHGDVVKDIIDNGVVSAEAPAKIEVVTLNFTANGGDGYPIKANAENFRYLLADGTVSAAVDEALDLTAAATFATVGQTAATILGEQKAFQDFLLANHATPATAYGIADTPQTGDVRIQNLNTRVDTVLTYGEHINGDATNNVLTGTAHSDALYGFDGSDTLFDGDGGAIALNGGDVARYYELLLNRPADFGGFRNWNEGQGDIDVINGIMASAEFLPMAALDNTAFVKMLYQNGLDRTPDTEGLNHWVAQLAGGKSRAEVVLGFGQSTETLAHVAPSAFASVAMGEGEAASLFRLYDAAFNRAPDEAGYLDWLSKTDGGQTLSSVADAFIGSQEFVAQYGTLSDTAFITQIYQNVLNRAPETAGLTNWLSSLAAPGGNRADLVVGIINSQEAQTVQGGNYVSHIKTEMMDWNDILEGGNGNDILIAGRGADTFVFRSNFGADTVHGYTAGMDTFDLSFVTGLDTFSQLAFTQQGGDVHLAFNGNSILIADTELASVRQSDFIL